MRQIKFRYTCEDMSGQMFQIFKELTDFLNGGMNMHGRIQAIVAVDQYTGLKDRNGVEIYEGDVLKHHDQNLINWVVCFENGCFGIKNGTHHNAVFYPIDSQYFFVDRIVIGNIHTKTDSNVQP